MVMMIMMIVAFELSERETLDRHHQAVDHDLKREREEGRKEWTTRKKEGEKEGRLGGWKEGRKEKK